MELFDLWEPEAPPVPLIVSIPHSGTWIPPEIRETLTPEVLRECPGVDWHLRALYDFLPGLGVTTLVANVARLVVDLNRPSVFRPLYPGRPETCVVTLHTPQGQAIFRQPPDAAAVQERIQHYWQPYQQQLQSLLDRTQQQFGHAFLVDAHSVAAGAALLHCGLLADIYLGDRDGHTCDHRLMHLVSDTLHRHGYRTRLNNPYKGGYIVDYYGGQTGVQALEIELCQHIYMDERQPLQFPGEQRLAPAQSALRDVFASVIRYLQPDWQRPAPGA